MKALENTEEARRERKEWTDRIQAAKAEAIANGPIREGTARELIDLLKRVEERDSREWIRNRRKLWTLPAFIPDPDADPVFANEHYTLEALDLDGGRDEDWPYTQQVRAK